MSREQLFNRALAELPAACAALDGAQRITPIRGIGPLARRVSRVSGPGYLLVGDAAGFGDPFTGEGVYRALRGAKIAADVIDRALRVRQVDVSGSYARARRAAFQDKERVCWLVQLFLSRLPLFQYVVARLALRPALLGKLTDALGDLAPARPVLAPSFLSGLLRP